MLAVSVADWTVYGSEFDWSSGTLNALHDYGVGWMGGQVEGVVVGVGQALSWGSQAPQSSRGQTSFSDLGVGTDSAGVVETVAGFAVDVDLVDGERGSLANDCYY